MLVVDVALWSNGCVLVTATQSIWFLSLFLYSSVSLDSATQRPLKTSSNSRSNAAVPRRRRKTPTKRGSSINHSVVVVCVCVFEYGVRYSGDDRDNLVAASFKGFLRLSKSKSLREGGAECTLPTSVGLHALTTR